jgi:hypothetical protein
MLVLSPWERPDALAYATLDIDLGGRHTLVGSEAIPFQCFNIVLRHALTLIETMYVG